MSTAAVHKHHSKPKHPAKAPEHPAHVTNFVRIHLSDARAVSSRTGVPAEVILAQSALESDWGRRVVGNAYFGVKGTSSSGNSTRFATHEVMPSGQRVSQVDQFRSFASYSEAADDYASLIQRRYSGAMAYKSDPQKFAEAVAGRHYATDPDYGAKLKSILRVRIIPLMGQQSESTAEQAVEHAAP